MLAKLDSFFKVKKNFISEHAHFNRRSQLEEIADQYIMALYPELKLDKAKKLLWQWETVQEGQLGTKNGQLNVDGIGSETIHSMYIRQVNPRIHKERNNVLDVEEKHTQRRSVQLKICHKKGHNSSHCYTKTMDSTTTMTTDTPTEHLDTAYIDTAYIDTLTGKGQNQWFVAVKINGSDITFKN